MLEWGKNIKELVGAKRKKAETRKRTTYQRISRKLKVKGKRSLAAIRRSDGQSPKHLEVKVMLEKILNSRNIERALRAVERNKGSGGIDDMQSDELRPFINANRKILVDRLLEGSYKPSPGAESRNTQTTGRSKTVGYSDRYGQDDPTSHISGFKPDV